jgi:hypothetical protein
MIASYLRRFAEIVDERGVVPAIKSTVRFLSLSYSHYVGILKAKKKYQNSQTQLKMRYT